MAKVIDISKILTEARLVRSPLMRWFKQRLELV